ncbi:MAG: class II aldolase/adducin family protein [Pseudomonadota bacterium]|jgi:ribulose-5-phosphate 4-epimerase/fuculose-1-phosphate aldolase|nr:aldolase [Rhodospirillaceae bacterium]MBO22897.1 aldolase [Rhodospirillaceae bacterium]MEE2721292.1 class II aldolase/adducin family protein [Pseudomonadota bacterium]
MADLEPLLRDLVVANRILANENVVDAYGHVSIRNPNNPDHYFLSCSRSPELVQRADIMEFRLDGTPVDGDSRNPYLERFIHGAAFERNQDIQAVVHSHAEEVLPFTISSQPLLPVIHSAGFMGPEPPVWDIADKFGDTTLLVVNMDQGRDLAEAFSKRRIVLMRGHGFAAAGRSLSEVVRLSVMLPRNAKILTAALQFGGLKPLRPGEIALRQDMNPEGKEFYRAWEYWATRAGCADMLDS